MVPPLKEKKQTADATFHVQTNKLKCFFHLVHLNIDG